MATPETQRIALDAALDEIHAQAQGDDLEASEADETGRVAVEGTLDVAELVRTILGALL